MAEQQLPILDVHTPSSSFAIVYSSTYVSGYLKVESCLITLADTEDSLETLYEKLTRKLAAVYHGQAVGPGWVKYSWNESTWNLDDGEPLTLGVCPPSHCHLLEISQSLIIPSSSGGRSPSSLGATHDQCFTYTTPCNPSHDHLHTRTPLSTSFVRNLWCPVPLARSQEENLRSQLGAGSLARL